MDGLRGKKDCYSARCGEGRSRKRGKHMRSLRSVAIFGSNKAFSGKNRGKGLGGWAADGHKMGEDLVGSLHVMLWTLDFWRG